MRRRWPLAGVVAASVVAGQSVQVRGWPELIVAVVCGGGFWILATKEQP